MKTAAESIFIKPPGMRCVISSPAKIAIPSTIKNASIVPRNKYICFLVFEAKSRMDSCVLSPNSAKPTTIKGINRSGTIFVSAYFKFTAEMAEIAEGILFEVLGIWRLLQF